MPQPLPVETMSSGPFAGIAVLRLEQPGKPVVVLELELMQRLEATLAGLPRTLRGLVLASASERVFVAGADLKAIMALSDRQLDEYLQYGSRVFGMISDLPCRTCAAINGAALGGGLEIAMHCDGLIAAPAPVRDGVPKPYPVGLPEAGLSICPGWGGTNLLPARMDPAEALRRTASGKTMLVDEAAKFGLFDRVAPGGPALLETAMQWLVDQEKTGGPARRGGPSRWIGASDGQKSSVLKALDAVRDELIATPPGAAVVQAVDAGLTRGWQAALAVERERLIALRNSPEGKRAIEAFFAGAKK